MYLRLWGAWVSHCRRSGFSPSDPPPGAIPNWLQLNAAPSGLAISAFKSLSWMARVSGLPSVHAQLQTPLCTAFLTATVPLERREFVVWLERKVLCPDTPMQEALLMSSVLALVWASLRWNDGLWSLPDRLVLQSGSTAVTGLAIRAKSCRASMPWGCQLYVLTGGPSACWGLSWLITCFTVPWMKRLAAMWAVPWTFCCPFCLRRPTPLQWCRRFTGPVLCPG